MKIAIKHAQTATDTRCKPLNGANVSQVLTGVLDPWLAAIRTIKQDYEKPTPAPKKAGLMQAGHHASPILSELDDDSKNSDLAG
jgi:hypothetical protein